MYVSSVHLCFTVLLHLSGGVVVLYARGCNFDSWLVSCSLRKNAGRTVGILILASYLVGLGANYELEFNLVTMV